MKRKINFIILGVFILLLSGAFLYLYKNNKTENTNGIKKVCFGKDCFVVELAKTPEELSRGLMFRESLGEDRGMLFIFETQGVYNFWMKNTKIPLDIIWINDEKGVVFIKNSAQPCEENFCPSIGPDAEANYVLEINAGLAEKIGLNAQSKAIFQNF